jgi:translation initiation factor IF-3
MAQDLVDVGEIESEPNLDGRNMVMMLAPKRN